MKIHLLFLPLILLSGIAVNVHAQTPADVPVTSKMKAVDNPKVRIVTTEGDIIIQLNSVKAPVSVNNFLSYAREGFYNGTVFHRVLPNFMIQGGGFNESLNRKATKAPIKNEAKNELKNIKGSISMARTSVVDSATSQFFINLADNQFLDHGVRDYGYAVFGKVISGFDVVESIGVTPTKKQSMHMNVPIKPVIIKSVEIMLAEPEESAEKKI